MDFLSYKLPGCNFNPLILTSTLPCVYTDLPAPHLACYKYLPQQHTKIK